MSTATLHNQDLGHFIGAAQRRAMAVGCRGDVLHRIIRVEEAAYFMAKIAEYGKRVKEMPETYEQDGLGDKALVHLHYFTASCDWYITEKDSDPDGKGQIQAFGLADLGHGGELGYISIKELIQHGAELDLHWTIKPLSAIQ